MQISVKAPAKINLVLDILSKREDGFHEISTVFQSVSLYDTVTVKYNSSDNINIICENSKVPLDESNLCYKAAKAYFERFSNSRGIDIIIDKKIPIAAGLAGGSADAAATLLALSLLCDKGNGSELLDIAASLGSDVPFCYTGGTALAVGTGIRLRRLHPMRNCKIVIAKPNIDISAGHAYSLYDEKGGKPVGKTFNMVMALHFNDVNRIAGAMFNGFEQVIHYDEIELIKQMLFGFGALNAMLSGSGSAVFGIFDSENGANKAVDLLRRTNFEAFVTEPVDDGCTVIEQAE